jgi:hypothetical protein
MNLRYKLGKLPAVKNSVSFRLRDYLKLSEIPSPPQSGGHIDLITEHNMFGNDTVGDCTCADVGHATLYWNKEAGKNISVSTENVLAMYTAITGYNGDPMTDKGANMADVAKYHQKVGLQDEAGTYHKISAYMAVTPGNVEEIRQCIYLFGACSMGWELPESAQRQTQAHKPWAVKEHSPIEGGHDTLAVGYDNIFLYVVTWGQIQKVTWGFVYKYMDEGIVKLSEEMLENGKSLEGFDSVQLIKDINSL